MRSSVSSLVLTAIAAAVMAGCAGPKAPLPLDPPTIATLSKRSVEIPADGRIAVDAARAIAAYKAFLAVNPSSAQRPEAMRRLGDLELDRAETAGNGNAADYAAAIGHYEALLKAHPNDPGNDRVLYQLARAHEGAARMDVALATLDRLIQAHPATPHRIEAQFRRGEIHFALQRYKDAEAAYADVLARAGSEERVFRERALFMSGWSVYKQGRLEEALAAFFGVLDLKIAGKDGDSIEAIEGLSRADRELVEDTFRVTSLGLAALNGAETIARYIDSDARRSYEFRVHQQLAELYLKQERVKDSADTLAAFARAQPLHAQAPKMLSRVIGIYEQQGFASQALEAKKAYVVRYGVDSEFRRANPQGWEAAQPLIKTHLAELARHHHAQAQQGRQRADVQEAVRWYRLYLSSFPQDESAVGKRFLLAELLFEDKQFADAAREYETVAYQSSAHPKRADAGYAALLAYAEQGRGMAAAEKAALDARSIDSSVRFADAFGADARVGSVLTQAAEVLFAARQADRAVPLAERVLALQPPAGERERRTATTVIAHAAFERGDFAVAERSYAQVLALLPERDAARADLVERQAAAVYKQGEKAREAGDARTAVGHFARVGSVAPQSAAHAAAQYDAAAALIGLKDWSGAAQALEDFRSRFPNHALAAELPPKLALAYLEQKEWARAAAEFERIAGAATEPEVARDALFQAASLQDKAGGRNASTRLWERYLKLHPEPIAPALEARAMLVANAAASGDAKRVAALQKEIFDTEARAGSQRTERTRTLGALAALTLAEPAAEAYRKVLLREPLQRTLKDKKARLETALKAYVTVSEYGVAEATTAATFHTAALYHDFGRALLQSERPKRLKKAELEQYNVMLEEQAFPFEEKAFELHETNARRAPEGLWNDWVGKSFAALAELRPVRYGKVERQASGAAAEANARGITLRREGKFKEAKSAYEQAIAADPAAAAPLLNLAILHELYLGERERALELYERHQALVSPADTAVSKWVADLKNRIAPTKVVQRKEGA